MTVDIEAQHIRVVLAYRAEPHVLLLDERAAEYLALCSRSFFDSKVKLLSTGDTVHTSVGRLLVVRVPDASGKPLVVDQWGRMAP